MFGMSSNSTSDKIAMTKGSGVRIDFDKLSSPVPFLSIFKDPGDSESTATFPLSQVIAKGLSFADQLKSIHVEVHFVHVKLNSGSYPFSFSACQRFGYSRSHRVYAFNRHCQVEGILPNSKERLCSMYTR